MVKLSTFHNNIPHKTIAEEANARQMLTPIAHILVVDDDPGTRIALPEMLRVHMGDVVVDTADSARQALAAVRETDYAVIVTDVTMPEMDGLELLSNMRALQPDTPIVLMTAHDGRDLIVAALRRGAYDFIQKPLDPAYFVASLQRAMRTRQLNAQVAAQNQALARHAFELEEAVRSAVADTEAAQRRLAFLADASTLLAASLDYETTLARVARLFVLYMADYCIVDVVENDGTLRCIGMAHRERAQEVLLREMRAQFQSGLNVGYPAESVLTTGQSLLCATVRDSLLEELARNATHLQILRSLNPRSWMIIPLESQGRILGVVSAVRTSIERTYTSDDLAAAEDLARRAALFVENARLYAESQSALALQKEIDTIKDRFFSVASHELRTPLTSIKGYAQLLQRRLAKENVDERVGRALESITHQVNRMARLVNEMLDITRIQNGQLALDYTPDVDVVALVQQTIEQHDGRDHLVHMTTPATPIHMTLDSDRIAQVLHNLINNACKYSDNGTEVIITIAQGQAPDDVIVSVRDHGIGISAEAQRHIFDQFYRAPNPEVQHMEGLGLGLFICQDIVQRHGGRLWLESIPDEGSTFFFALPATPPDAEAIAVSTPEDISNPA